MNRIVHRLSPADQDELVAAVRTGTPIKTALLAAGITVSLEDAEALEANPEARQLLRRIQQAQAEHEAEMVHVIHQCATTPNLKTGVPDWRAADAMLSKHPAYRDDWHDQRHIEVSGTLDHRLREIEALPDEEVLELTDPEFRALLQP